VSKVPPRVSADPLSRLEEFGLRDQSHWRCVGMLLKDFSRVSGVSL
jgi:hypothetical protein